MAAKASFHELLDRSRPFARPWERPLLVQRQNYFLSIIYVVNLSMWGITAVLCSAVFLLTLAMYGSLLPSLRPSKSLGHRPGPVVSDSPGFSAQLLLAVRACPFCYAQIGILALNTFLPVIGNVKSAKCLTAASIPVRYPIPRLVF